MRRSLEQAMKMLELRDFYKGHETLLYHGAAASFFFRFDPMREQMASARL